MRKNPFIVLAFFVISIVKCYGQVYEVPIRQRIDTATYIFEGQVLSTKSYWNSDMSNIYTSNIVHISKQLKGSLTCGTVQIITKGGKVGNIEEIISHNLSLVGGQTGVFFCTTTSWPTTAVVVSNPLPLEVYSSEQGFLKYITTDDGTEAVDVFSRYKNLPEMYTYISLRTGYTYIDCAGSELKKENDERRENFNSYMKLVQKKALLTQLNKQFHKVPESIIFTLNNVKVVGGVTDHLEFDLFARGSSNNTYFDNAVVKIHYNPAAFGTNVTANHKVIVNQGSILGLSYDTVHYWDFSDSELTVAVGLIYSSSPSRFQLTTTPVALAHISMGITSCIGKNANLYFTDTSTYTFFSAYAQRSYDTVTYEYDNAIAVDKNNLALCYSNRPQISGMSPTTITAGTNSVLTISGSNFGTVQGAVCFADANTLDPEVSVDKVDILTWTNTQITVVVPSAVDSGSFYSGKHHYATAGSGNVTVIDNSGKKSIASSVNDLTVTYSIVNTHYKPTGYKYRNSLIDTNSTGGYTFKYNTSFYANTIAREIFEKAMRDWKCETLVNFKTTSTTTTISANKQDFVNVVTFDALPAGVLGNTSRFSSVCPADTTKPFVYEIDFSFTNVAGVTWNMDTSYSGSVPANKYDFFSVVIHEMGHGCLLQHVVDPNETMGPSISRGMKRTTITTNAADGGTDVVQHSKLVTYLCGPHHTTALPGFLCTSSGVKKSLILEQNISLYPNPTNGELTLEMIDMDMKPITVSLFDMTGKEIYRYNAVSASADQISINELKTHPSGLYLMKVTVGTRVYNEKIIKQ